MVGGYGITLRLLTVVHIGSHVWQVNRSLPSQFLIPYFYGLCFRNVEASPARKIEL